MSTDYFALNKSGYDTILQDIDSIISTFMNLKNISTIDSTNISPTYIQKSDFSNKLTMMFKLRQEIYILKEYCDKQINT
jgi:hypothetical protein